MYTITPSTCTWSCQCILCYSWQREANIENLAPSPLTLTRTVDVCHRETVVIKKMYSTCMYLYTNTWSLMRLSRKSFSGQYAPNAGSGSHFMSTESSIALHKCYDQDSAGTIQLLAQRFPKTTCWFFDATNLRQETSDVCLHVSTYNVYYCV